MTKTSVPLFDNAVWTRHLAAFAPLPEAFVEHAFLYPGEFNPFPAPVAKPQRLFDQTWLHIQHARTVVSHFLVPAVSVQFRDRQPLTPRWVRRQFEIQTERKKPLPETTLQKWMNTNLLRSLARGSLEPNSMSAIFMMRYLFKPDFRYWHPAEQDEDAPWFHVWGVVPGKEPPQMYPYPLPDNLPANLLLYTQWIGASWLPGFISVPGVGALGWGKLKMHDGQWYWDITEDEMSQWDASFVRETSIRHRYELLAPIIAEQQQGFPDAQEHYLLTRTHRLAQLLLEHIGEPILADYMRHYFGDNKPPDKPFMPF